MPEPAIRWNPNFAAAQSKWPLRASGRRKAEQGATDFEEGPNQSSIGCCFLSTCWNPKPGHHGARSSLPANARTGNTMESQPAGIQNPDIHGARSSLHANDRTGNTMESQLRSCPEQVARQEPERRCADPEPSKGQLTSRRSQTSRASNACFSL